MRALQGVNRGFVGDCGGSDFMTLCPNATLGWQYSTALIGPRCRIKDASAASPSVRP
jgi:hypothetical protein